MHKKIFNTNYVYDPNLFFVFVFFVLWSLIQLLTLKGFKTKLIIFAISRVTADMDSNLSFEYFAW